jgi:hypothetical protein
VLRTIETNDLRYLTHFRNAAVSQENSDESDQPCSVDEEVRRGISPTRNSDSISHGRSRIETRDPVWNVLIIVQTGNKGIFISSIERGIGGFW